MLNTISYRAIKDSRKIHNEDSKLNEKPKRVPSWKRHLIEKKKNKIGKVVKFVPLLPWQHTKCHGYTYVYICISYKEVTHSLCFDEFELKIIDLSQKKM